MLTVGIGHRFYNPGLGRWVSRDPIGENAGPGLLLFVQNSPVTGVDVMGLDRYISQFDYVGIGGTGRTIFHVGVAVDVWVCDRDGRWKVQGQHTFDFSIAPAGLWNYIKGVFWKARGRVESNPGLALEAPCTIKSTPCQDRLMLQRLEEQVRNPPFYNALAFNCIPWSVAAADLGMHESCCECCTECGEQ